MQAAVKERDSQVALRIVFMGTPSFAVPVLAAILDAGHHVAGVYTQPDKPAGRRQRLSASPVKEFALGRGLSVFQPASLKRPEARDELRALSPDVIAVAAYGKLLPPGVLEIPPLGSLNVHPSLLPRYRGPSPVVAAILNGDDVAGVTIMRLDEGMDTGPIVDQHRTEIGPDESVEDLTLRLFEMGAGRLVEVLPGWASGEIEARSQDESEAVVTKLLTKEDGRIDWGMPAPAIARQVRAFHPWPGSFTQWRGETVKVIEASAVPQAVVPMARVALLEDRRVVVGAGEGALEILRAQLPGKRPVSAAELVRGHPEFVGSTLG